MKSYQFRDAFIRYTLLLTAIMFVLYGSLIFIYNNQVNTEIKETSEQNLKDLKVDIQSKESINKGRYYIIQSKGHIENHSKLSYATISKILERMKNSKSYKYEGTSGIFYIIKDRMDQKTIYSITDVSDYEETKDLLYNLMLFLMLFTLLFIVGAAYYLAIKPIRAYEEMLRSHQTFLQNTTHEMKTPIASVSLGIDYIKALEPNLTDKSLQSISKMKQEIQYIQSLISKTLNISSKIDRVAVNIIPILDYTIEQFENLFQMKIERNYDASIIYTVNEDDIKQIMTILLDNAIKHNCQLVDIRVKAMIKEQHLILEVIDNGIGIQQDQIPFIFDRYYRGNTGIEGSGLGLDILKLIIKQYNGTIEVQSEQYKQTKFILTL
ncbi:HAMP domain-containing sensor histidine kinase [Macrococcus capreoli]|uniref:sensor histidine kinase n=1 Tax=Macrococcus capreoli TaxID=2982690 RepID=UPI0021D5ABEA|nr:HAMP domain-containing sensor histidine kinase [Macrococcus sp. TMW 2.2395]